MQIPEHVLKRKGSTTTSGVPKEVRNLLDLGLIETVNLAEWLVVDQESLARNVFQKENWRFLLQPLEESFGLLKIKTAPKKMEVLGMVLAQGFVTKVAFENALEKLKEHRSDIVRSWACFMIGKRSELSLQESLKRIQPLAADKNMSVREAAWLAIRPRVITQLGESLRLLMGFSLHRDENIRRFASEITRPRGVWCNHIPILKENPELGLPLLEPLRCDDSLYVRNSVGNWLNDASKTKPGWVQDVCKRWEKESLAKETAYIIRRGLRTLRKNSD
ncbi:MAG: DNA alkylation repair protein [Gemmataceae bacterium]|nr:DNA alkylation repair protein [Gemmataceae bacterium]